MKLSIVSTLYRSAPYLEEFHRRVCAAASQITDDYEIVLVNDGSPDDSLQFALGLQAVDQHIQVVDLSRNFGHHAAIVAGLANSRGQHVFLMDCDLEEQPEWLPRFFEKLDETRADVVFGVQEERVASRFSNLLGGLFWSALNVMSNVRIPHNPMTCRLMSRRYVDSLLGVEDHVLYLAGVFAWTGFSQSSLPLKKVPRPAAHKSSYNLLRKLTQVADSFASFSVAPLSLIFLTGLAIWLGSILYALFLLVQRLLYPDIVLSGFTSIMLSIWFLGGTTILVLGLIGIYVAKIFQEVKRRPLYIVRNLYRGTGIE
ncbi:glycosyltransferase family 2 protein [Neisseriaceae bacterium TC5R-5]|nr:glycosyltransferase family 2 protein [Neisseriaceae bacterium TC5R-5]